MRAALASAETMPPWIRPSAVRRVRRAPSVVVTMPAPAHAAPPTGRTGCATDATCADAPRASMGATSGRSAVPERHTVNTPDHANIALNAMTSNRARLMVAVTNNQAPANRKTKTTDVEITRRLGRR